MTEMSLKYMIANGYEPMIKVNGSWVWLDKDHAMEVDDSGANDVWIATHSLTEQCEECGRDISSETCSFTGNPCAEGPWRSRPHVADSVVECECGSHYEVEWRRRQAR